MLLGTLSYGLFQARTLMTGPELTVTHPLPGETQHATLMQIQGTVHNVTRIQINGRTVTTDPSGTFSDTLVTPRGYGVIVVQAENRFGYQTEERIEFYGNPPDRAQQG